MNKKQKVFVMNIYIYIYIYVYLYDRSAVSYLTSFKVTESRTISKLSIRGNCFSKKRLTVSLQNVFRLGFTN